MKKLFAVLLTLLLLSAAASADTRLEAGGYALTFDKQMFDYSQNIPPGMDFLIPCAAQAKNWSSTFIVIISRAEGAEPDWLPDLQKDLERMSSDAVSSGFRLVPEAEPQFLLYYTCEDDAFLPEILAVVDSFAIVPDGPLAFYVPVNGALERREIEGRLTPMALTDALNAAGAFPEPVAADAISIGPRGAQVYLDGAFQSMLDRADADAEALYRKSLEDTFRENYRVETVHLFFHSGSSAGTDTAD